MPSRALSGTGVAIITPFKKDFSIDYDALSNLIDFQINNKVEYIVVLGTTGESVTLDNDEKESLIRFASQRINGRVPMVVGVGGNHTQEIINKLKHIDLHGASAILSVAPYYNKPTQQGIFEHYKAIAAASKVPVILYNVPGRTGMNMTAETTLRLAEVNNVLGMKEASGNMGQIMEIIRNKPDDFMLISGDDALALPIIAAGGEGAISVIANAYPSEYSEMIRFALDGNIAAARKLHYHLLEIMNNLFIDGNPAGIKAILNIKQMIENVLRLPLVPASDKTYTKLTFIIKEREMVSK